MKMATKWSGALALAALISVPLQAAEPVKVGSKIDTEGALLGNMIQQVLENHGVKTINKIQLGTTPVVREAVLKAYPQIADWLKPVFASLDEKTLQQLNARIAVEGQDAKRVAADYLQQKGLLK
ncbi:TPA: glycine betaine ABC transporter substrate-binding protein [Klebsiella quasipneumoniae subsp. quasipneumoniae]|nr:glycine/betaine ABC transporter substrate-binding protein [Klebsiella quasipneumoniae]PLN72941.1 glycine/betaine ABC transporter substrate-binding protein [Klebsiella quasipneumoniae]